jgi:hypothetical protein
VAGFAVLAVGCKGGSESKDGTGKAGAASKEKDKAGVGSSHDEVIAAYQLRIGEFDKKIADLKDKSGKAAGDEKGKLEGKLKDATAKREVAEKKLGDLKAAAADKWDAAKKDVDAAVDDLRKAVE